MSRGLWLTAEQISYVRAELRMGNKTHAEIAKRLEVDHSVVSRIATGKRKKNGVSCICGWCTKCKNREASERYRERKKRDAKERSRRIAA